MIRVRVTLERCIQDSQDFGGSDEHMISRVFFSIESEGKAQNGHVDLKQTVGTNYESGPIEVGPPVGYSGPFDYNVFRQEVTDYYRRCIGTQSAMLSLAPGARDVRMRANVFECRHSFDLVADGGGGAW